MAQPQGDEICPFNEFGCDFQGSRKYVQEHIKNEPNKHMLLMADAAQQLITLSAALKENVENMSTKVDERNLNLLNSKKLMGAQFVWKIPFFRSKFNDAQRGTGTVVFSQPFFIPRHGYKLMASVWPFGDGAGRGTHMAMYVSICKGEYDSLLQWPFLHKITLTLIDQAQDPNGRQNITYTVNPTALGESKPFLRRPTGEKNAAFGAAKLCTLEEMHERDYIRDDTLFIKVEIDVAAMMVP